LLMGPPVVFAIYLLMNITLNRHTNLSPCQTGDVVVAKVGVC
jgi:hypothetical protein